MGAECFYCGRAVELIQHDHYPIPASAGGTATVAACLHCHNMKDRVSDAIFRDYLLSHADDVDVYVFSEAEIKSMIGEACLLEDALQYLVSDMESFKHAAVRIAIARMAAHWYRVPAAGRITKHIQC